MLDNNNFLEIVNYIHQQTDKTTGHINTNSLGTHTEILLTNLLLLKGLQHINPDQSPGIRRSRRLGRMNLMYKHLISVRTVVRSRRSAARRIPPARFVA